MVRQASEGRPTEHDERGCDARLRGVDDALPASQEHRRRPGLDVLRLGLALLLLHLSGWRRKTLEQRLRETHHYSGHIAAEDLH